MTAPNTESIGKTLQPWENVLFVMSSTLANMVILALRHLNSFPHGWQTQSSHGWQLIQLNAMPEKNELSQLRKMQVTGRVGLQ